MDYKKAKELRGKKFSELMTEKLLGDQGVSDAFRNTQSEKSKARALGIKEKFDPMNIAKALTGGSRLAPAIVGKLMGRSQEDMEYFAGTSKKGKKLEAGALNIHKKFELDKDDPSIKVLGLIYREMLRTQEAEKAHLIDEQKNQKDEAVWEDKRNKQLIDALNGRNEKLTRNQKKAERRKERKEEKQVTKAETKPAPKETKPAPTKAAPKAEKAPPKETPKAPEKVPAKEVPKEAPKPPPKTETPAPSTQKPTAAKAPSIGGKIATGAALGVASGAAAVISALVEAGLSQKAQANILAQVEAESNFKPQSENLNYTKAEGIQNTFGKGRIPTLEFAQGLVKNPEALAEAVYGKDTKAGKSLGNTAEGDGYKYRGRGYIQHTGKAQYEAIKKYTGIDVVSNPDLLNEPSVAAKAIAWFFLIFKGKKPEQLENIATVNKAVGFADKKLKSGEMESDHRVKLAEKYANGVPGVPTNQSLPASLPPATGDKIDKSSKENKELKDKKDSSAMQVNNNTNITNKSGGSSTPSKPKGDDTNAYQQKVQQ